MIKKILKGKGTFVRITAAMLLFVMLSLQLMACQPDGPTDETTVGGDNTTQEVTGNVDVPQNEAIITVAGGFKMDGTELYTNVTSENASFDFETRISVPSLGKWEIFTDAEATQPTGSKVVTLSEGENSYYIKVTRKEESTIYHATINYRAACTVEFYSNSSVAIDTQVVSVGGVAEVPVTPIKKGHTFEGWYLDGEKYDFSTKVNESVTLIGHWTKNSDSFSPSNTAVPTYTSLDASIHVVWKDYANNLELRPESVKCILTQAYAGGKNIYEIVVSKDGVRWADGTTAPAGIEISKGDGGGWTLYVKNLPEKTPDGKFCSYTLMQEELGGNYSTQQFASAAINTINGYVPAIDESAALTTRNGRLYDAAGNMIVFNGVVSINVGNKTYHSDLSVKALNKLKAIGTNAVRVTAQIVGDVGYGYVYFSNGSARTGDYNDNNAKRHSEADRQQMIASIDYAIKNATECGLYIVIDWGILTSNPMQYLNEASEFFGILAEKYADNPYVLFEICNEPQATWGEQNGKENSIKYYAEQMLELIRSKGSRSVVIVAPNNCSTALSAFSSGPVAGDDPIDMPLVNDYAYNVAYTFHCYPFNYKYETYSWKLRDAYEAGLTVIITEMSPMDGTFDNPDKLTYDMQETAKFLRQIREFNYGFFYFRYTSMQYTNLTIANYSETIMFVPNLNLIADDWSRDDMTESGKWYYDYLSSNGVFAEADFTTSQKKGLMATYKDKYAKDFAISSIFPGFAISATKSGNSEFFSVGRNDSLTELQYEYYCYLIFNQISTRVGAANVSGATLGTLPKDKAEPMILKYRFNNVDRTVTVMYGTNTAGNEYGITVILK